MSTPISIAIAGTTKYTTACAQALFSDGRFVIPWVLTPTPKPIGRKKIITNNPFHIWAIDHNIPTILVDKKINTDVQLQIEQHAQTQSLDFLLVVDFGYLIPSWLLQLPTIAPLNIHPSDLPKYRGSSPGQFALLYGEKKSAVTFMKMDEGLDTGNILSKIDFDIDPNWDATAYYDHAFSLISADLPDLTNALAEGEIMPEPQPLDSPTPVAKRLSKEDSFVDWELLLDLIAKKDSSTKSYHAGKTSELLQTVFAKNQSWPQTILQAVHALNPWPGVWTVVPTSKGEKRMKILEIEIHYHQLTLKTVQLEGLTPQPFQEIQAQLSQA